MTPDGPYVMNVMAFGFANAPTYFQRWMTDILAPVGHLGVENYLDDTATHHVETPSTYTSTLQSWNNSKNTNSISTSSSADSTVRTWDF